MSETIEEKDLLPTSFVPISKRRFIVNIEGIDSFLVKSVSYPPFSSGKDNVLTVKEGNYLFVSFNSPISPSAIQQLVERINNHNTFPIDVKHVDDKGTVISYMSFNDCSLVSFVILPESYEDTDFQTIEAAFSMPTVTVHY